MPDYRLYSIPVPIVWAGFETDTYKLQQAGWSISAAQNIHNYTMQIAICHKQGGMRGLSMELPWEYMQEPDWHRAKFPVIHMRMISEKVYIERIAGAADGFDYFAPIDAVPRMMEFERKSLDDFVHFAPLRAKGILLPEASVPELMDQILKLQQPMREREILRDLKSTPIVHAQIMSLAA
jgi:hypothetical protein